MSKNEHYQAETLGYVFIKTWYKKHHHAPIKLYYHTESYLIILSTEKTELALEVHCELLLPP